jgi:thiamine biosynthesis lipoprotein
MAKQLRLLMGMPITVEICDPGSSVSDINKVFDYFISIDNRFSVYKTDSEISLYNQKKLTYSKLSADMKLILKLSNDTKVATHGYFDIRQPDDSLDPSGLVKGWAIFNAANLIKSWGFKNYYVDAGGDIQVNGLNRLGKPWTIGIRNPADRRQNIKIVTIGDQGIATSGTYIRGQHVYDPFAPDKPIKEIVSLTVIGPNVYEADRFATAAFAMRDFGVAFIATLTGFEAYSINSQSIATFTPGFAKYVVQNK